MAACEVMFSRTMSVELAVCLGHATREPEGEAWWSQTGSNRRPHACKACALPAELWPRTRRRMLFLRVACSFLRALFCPDPRSPSLSRWRQPSFTQACQAGAAQQRRLVGLGRLELPTSRLSSARSNQLSYKPPTTKALQRPRSIKGWEPARAHRLAPDDPHKRSPWRVFVREERET
jgi:hypothetical protein